MSSKRKAARTALDQLFNAKQAPIGTQYTKRTKVSAHEAAIGLQSATNTATIARIVDAFSNPAARTGYGTSSLENYGEYPLLRWSLQFWQVVAFFESSWIARRIVCAPAEDIVKTWPKITSDIEPDDITRIDRAIRRTNTRSKIREAIERARLFGGAGALIAIDGQDKELDKPLDLKSVGIHGYKGLITFDRWSGISPTGDVCDDLNRPLDFGHSEFYDVRVKGGDSFKVHSSRILRFSGPRMPEPENSAYSDWGISVLAPVIQTIQGYDTLTSNALSLSFRANILGMKAPDLAGMMSGLSMNQAAAQKFEQRMQRFNEMLSNQSLALLEKDGELSQTQYSFTGLSDMMQMWQLAISGAAKMPVTRLWGRTYSGLGQAGDGDEKIYEETISTESDVTLRPALEKLYPVLCMSELGEVPDDLDLLFPSIRVLDDKEKAELAKAVVDTAVVALNAGGISLRTFAKELKQSSTRTEIFTNITDEDIAALSDKVQAEGEMGAGLFGEGGGDLNPSSSPAKALKEENKVGKANSQPDDVDEPQGHRGPANGAQGKDAGLRQGVTKCQWCGDGLDDDDVAEVNGFVVCPDCADAYRRGRANDADGFAVETKTIHGLPVVIEQKRGQWRTGQGWRIKMNYDYGYFQNIPGADGDSLDICIGPDPSSTWVYVFDQKHLPPRRGFDESKVFCHYSSMDDAIKAFKAGHDRAVSVYMDVTPMQVDDFKKWLKKHDMSKPAGSVKP